MFKNSSPVMEAESSLRCH